MDGAAREAMIPKQRVAPRKPALSIEQFLAGYPPRMQRLVERLRRLVKATVPGATERVYPVWRGIGYRHPTAGYFCGIFPSRDRVRLGFEYGVWLPDPDHLLHPGPTHGKKVRYVEITRLRDVQRTSLATLLRAAVQVE